jgi:hypothetical protein
MSRPRRDPITRIATDFIALSTQKRVEVLEWLARIQEINTPQSNLESAIQQTLDHAGSSEDIAF